MLHRIQTRLAPPLNGASVPDSDSCPAATIRPALSAAVGIGERYPHGVDRGRRNDAREKEPGDTNHDRKSARERLPRYDIAITNRETGDEGEIQRVRNRPALDKANQQAQAKLKS